MTYNVALALGCHVDPDNFNLDSIRSEERRRVWAGLMMCYTIQNTALGNLDPQMQLSHNVRLPADVDDADINADGLGFHRAGPTQMSYVLFKFRLYNISARIGKEILNASEPSRDMVQSLDQEIAAERGMWDSKNLLDSTFESLPAHNRMNVHILHGYSYQLYLLFHRPFFHQSFSDLGNFEYSRLRCISSAKASVDLHRTLCETPQFAPYKWFTTGLGSFHAFHSAVVLAVALPHLNEQDQYLEILRDLEGTIQRFENLSSRSQICAKATPILKSLM